MDQDAVRLLAARRQRDVVRDEALDESLEQARHARQDADLAADSHDRHPTASEGRGEGKAKVSSRTGTC